LQHRQNSNTSLPKNPFKPYIHIPNPNNPNYDF
jgi:hypothetical protein